MRFISLFIIINLSFTTVAQDIAAFSDYKKNFWIFDAGNFRQLEFQPVLEYQTGDKCIGYVTNSNHLKVYYNHIDFDLTSLVTKYTVTDNLMSYQVGSQLYVFEDGKKQLLSKFVGNYLTGDSLVAYFDTENYWFNVYYNGKNITLADGLLYENTNAFIVGPNMMAFIDQFKNFIVFYQGETYELLQTDLIQAKIGRNIMAFIDPITDFLQVFYEGEVIELETFKPKSYQVGYEKVAYVDNMGDFKMFDNGETYTIENFEPDEYFLKDNMLVYYQQGQLWAFYDGESYLVENYIPSSFKINDTDVAYIDQNGFLNHFENGERKILSYEKINDYTTLRNLIIFNEGMNTNKVYYEGNIYVNE